MSDHGSDQSDKLVMDIKDQEIDDKEQEVSDKEQLGKLSGPEVMDVTPESMYIIIQILFSFMTHYFTNCPGATCIISLRLVATIYFL